MLLLKSIKKIYNTSKTHVIAIDDISIELPDKGLVFIMGESGSGKTTLLNLMSGLDSCTEGSVCLNDKEITSYSEREWDTLRNRHMGIVFQSFNLIEDMSVKENLELPLKILAIDSNCIDKRVVEALEYVNLAGYENRRTHELSAGQKQRIAIARAIIKRPDILLADEPTGNLDPVNSKAIFELLEDISKHCLVVIITHDNTSAYKYADRIIKIAEGRVVEDIDNISMKKLVKHKHKFLLHNNKTGKTVTEDIFIDEFDIKEQVLNAYTMLKSSEKEIDLALKIEISEFEQEKDDMEWEQCHNTKRLGIFEILKNSMSNLKKRKFRLGITVILFAFTSMLCLLFAQLNANDYIKALSMYMSEKDIDKVHAYKDIKIYEEDEIKQEAQLYSGKTVYEDLVSVVGENNLLKCYSGIEVEYYDKEGMAKYNVIDAVIYSDEKALEEVDICGRLPITYNEITLDKETSRIFKITEDNLNESITVGGEKFTLVGILNEDIIDGISFSILSDKYIENEKVNAESIEYRANGIVESVAVKVYVETSEIVGKIGDVTRNESFSLCYGRVPEKENEIMISLEMAEQIGYEGNEYFPTDFKLPDLYDEKYQGIYDDCINMYDFLGKKIKVVGIYEDYYYEDSPCPSIAINDVAYEKIKEQYYQYFCFDRYIIFSECDDAYGVLEKLNGMGYRIDTEVSRYVYAFMDISSELKTIMIWVIVVCCIIALFMMISYIIYNVNDHSKKIGVLRAIGVSNKDILRMFLYETIGICVISALLSAIGMDMVIGLLNTKIGEMTAISGLVMMVCDNMLTSKIIVAVIFAGIALTILPLLRLMKKKSITLINNNPEG